MKKEVNKIVKFTNELNTFNKNQMSVYEHRENGEKRLIFIIDSANFGSDFKNGVTFIVESLNKNIK